MPRYISLYCLNTFEKTTDCPIYETYSSTPTSTEMTSQSRQPSASQDAVSFLFSFSHFIFDI